MNDRRLGVARLKIGRDGRGGLGAFEDARESHGCQDLMSRDKDVVDWSCEEAGTRAVNVRDR